MERDLERLIQKKVMDAERQPVAWRKEQVWANISTGLQPKKADHRIYYYAAACIVLLMAAGIYFVMPPSHNHNQRAASMDQPKTSVEITTPDSTGESAPTPIPVVAPQNQNPVASNNRKITTTPELTVPETSVVTNEEHTLPATDTLPSPTVADVIQPQQKERIKPVIGVFDSSEPEQEMVARKKRKKLPLFRPSHDDKSPLENPSENIIARIH